MRSCWTARLLVAITSFALGLPVVAAVPNRIAGQVSDESRVALAHSVSPKVAAATDMGAAAESRRLEGMTLRFSMTDAQQAELTQLLEDQQNPASPQFRKWLTPQEFGSRFGLSPADVAQASAWLTTKGFTVDSVANSSTFIRFSGTVGQVQAAFGTSIRQLSVDGETHIANVTALTLPRGLAGVVGNVIGISDFRLKPHAIHRRQVPDTSVRPNYTISTGTSAGHYMVPADFDTIYDVNPLLNGTPAINGSGIGIVVIGQVDIYPNDIATFRSASGLVPNAPTIKVYGTDPGYPSNSCTANYCPSSSDLDESELDVEWAGAIAPAAKITFVTSNDVLMKSLVDAVADNLAPIITSSYGACESSDPNFGGFSAAEINTLNLTLQQAQTQGITVLSASGDVGATDCDSGSTVRSATHGLWVDYPASSPLVTGVGGTTFVENGGTYWSSANATNGGSALSYIPETVWNDTAARLPTNSTYAFSAGGGGASVLSGKPAWQTGTGVPSDGHRDVPDVSFSASADHDSYVVCIAPDCTHGFLDASNTLDVGGGTSFAAPSFAGIVALVEQKLGGTRLGNLNPYLYSLASGSFGAQIFHDVTTGDNKSPCTAGSTNCPSGGSIGYSATVGYDLASGLGSVDAFQLVNNFASATLQKTTTTAVTFTPANPVIGQNVVFTATIAGSSGSSVPTGTVSFSVNGGTATSVAVSSAGIATFTTSFNTGGAQTMTAVYSGDTNFYGSTGTATATVVVSSGVPTTTALTASSSTVPLTGSLTLTATVSSSTPGTLAGTVTFTAGSVTLGTVALVAGSGGNTGTTVLTLTVSAASLPIGTDSITATFNGGGTPTGAQSYLQSTSSPLLLTVTNPTITLAATNITVASGGTGSSTITLVSGGNYTGSVNLTASSASTLSGSYVFTPNPVSMISPGTNGTSTFKITSATASLRRASVGAGEALFLPRSHPWAWGGGATLAGMLFFGLPGSRRRRWHALLTISVLAALAGGLGCGSSSTTTTSGPKTGTFTVTVVGTDTVNGSITGTTTFTITIQ